MPIVDALLFLSCTIALHVRRTRTTNAGTIGVFVTHWPLSFLRAQSAEMSSRRISPQVVDVVGEPFTRIGWDVSAQDDSNFPFDYPLCIGPFVLDFTLAPQIEVAVLGQHHAEDVFAPVNFVEGDANRVVILAYVDLNRDVNELSESWRATRVLMTLS